MPIPASFTPSFWRELTRAHCIMPTCSSIPRTTRTDMQACLPALSAIPDAAPWKPPCIPPKATTSTSSPTPKAITASPAASKNTTRTSWRIAKRCEVTKTALGFRSRTTRRQAALTAASRTTSVIPVRKPRARLSKHRLPIHLHLLQTEFLQDPLLPDHIDPRMKEFHADLLIRLDLLRPRECELKGVVLEVVAGQVELFRPGIEEYSHAELR